MFAITSIILVNNFPFFIGLIPKKEYLNNIPSDYLNLQNFFTSKPEGKIFSLPETPLGAGPLMQWGSDNYIGPPADHFFTDRPTIDGYWLTSEKFPGLKKIDWPDTTIVENTEKLIKISGVLDVKYFLVHKDYLQQYEFPTSNGMILLNGPLKSKIAINKLNNSRYVKLIQSSADFNIYQRTYLPDWGKIYVPQQIIYSGNVKQKLFSYNKSFDNTYAILQTSDRKKAPFYDYSGNIETAYRENNPSSYTLEIKHAEYPLLLVFSETFHPQWQLISADGNKIPEDKHLKVNGYANAWIINEGSHFKLEFAPQKYFNLGLYVTLITLSISLLILFKNLYGKYKK